MKRKLLVIPPDPKAHAQKMYDLIAKTFSRGWGYFEFRDMCRDGYIARAPYDWRASRIGMFDGVMEAEPVTHFGVWRYTMRIGAARVRTGGIGAVATHHDYRKQGLMVQTASASLDAMRELGYDFSMLFGIDDFYHRFGYTRAWSDGHYQVKLADLPGGRPPRLKKAQLPDAKLDALFNRSHATVTGTSVRPTFNCINPLCKHAGFMLLSGQRRSGYIGVVDRGTRLDVIEATGDAEQCLRAAASLARRFGADDVRFVTMPYGGELATRLRASNCVVETQHKRCGGAMIRTINLPQALSRMSGELGRRLAGSLLAGWQGELTIADGRESVVLSISRGRIAVRPTSGARGRHAIRGGDEIAQLLIGADEPMSIVREHGIAVSADAVELLPIMFPEQHPMLPLIDRY